MPKKERKNATLHYCHVIIRNNERRHLTQEERKKQCVNSTVDQQFNMKFSNTMDQNSRISSETEQKVAPKLLSDEYIKKLPQRKMQKIKSAPID